jgi:predicted acyl esterase
LQSTEADTDLQVTLTEVRPDGKETYVQSGWLRASHRALAANATTLRPQHPFTEAAVQDLPAGRFVKARVELFPFAHVFRPGSRVRIVIDAPGASRPRWKFDALKPAGTVTNTVAFGGAHASRVVLPVVDVAAPGTPLPKCPSLRGQPCRKTARIVNTPVP